MSVRSKKSKALNSKAKFIYVNSIFTIVQYILVLNIQYQYLPAAFEGSVITDCCVERFVDCCAVEGISVERFVDAVFLGDTCLKVCCLVSCDGDVCFVTCGEDFCSVG